MFDSALSALNDRIDSNFLTAFWLPAILAVFANVGLLAVLMGPAALMGRADELDSVEQTFLALLLLLASLIVALLLRALALVIIGFFAGEMLPRIVAEWSTRGQKRARTHALRLRDFATRDLPAPTSSDEVRRLLEQRFPRDEAALRPTRFGNMLAMTNEYSLTVYEMDGLLWWPHLALLLPDEVRDRLHGAQAAMLGLLNLSLICGVLAVEAFLGLGLAGRQWMEAIGGAIGGVVLAWLCYQAAVNQTLEVAGQIRVSFNLYRHAILTQLNRSIPDDLASERALWQSLTQELLGSPAPAPAGDETATATRGNG